MNRVQSLNKAIKEIFLQVNERSAIVDFIIIRYFFYSGLKIGVLNDNELFFNLQETLGYEDFRYTVRNVKEGSFYEILPINLYKYGTRLNYLKDIAYNLMIINMEYYKTIEKFQLSILTIK
jgi:hypothetical protein